MDEPWLVIETSGRGGTVGLVIDNVMRTMPLDPARRHNRDLAPAVARLLADANLQPTDVLGVMVGIGPGSYTGLRVGLMTAKTFAWATGCQLVPVPTFHAIAERVPESISTVAVIADALQGLAYIQTFHREVEGWKPIDELRIEPATEWASQLPDEICVSGPGLAVYDEKIRPEIPRVPQHLRLPTAEALWLAGRQVPPVNGATLVGLEPLYLRGSSAEEKAKLTAGSGSGSG